MNRSSKPHATAHDPAQREALAADVSRKARRVLSETFARLAADSAGEQGALTVTRAGPPIAPVRLASAHPGTAADCERLRALYERCLAHYRDEIRAQDSERGIDDIGAAAARFVAACFEVLQGTRATPSMLLHLEHQLVGIVRRGPAWSKATASARQMCFEQMAILAVLFPETSARASLQGTAALADVRRGARRYLQTLLGLDPDGLTLGHDGLTVAARQEATTAEAA